LPASPHWLEQKHGAHVIELPNEDHEADASIARVQNIVCAVLTADCLPVLLADSQGEAVAAIHAGWRGLCQDIIEATVTKMAIPPGRLWAYLGPAIGPECYEVGEEMIEAFKPIDRAAFYKKGSRWHCDLFTLAKARLSALGIKAVFSDFCVPPVIPAFFLSARQNNGKNGKPYLACSQAAKSLRLANTAFAPSLRSSSALAVPVAIPIGSTPAPIAA